MHLCSMLPASLALGKTSNGKVFMLLVNLPAGPTADGYQIY